MPGCLDWEESFLMDIMGVIQNSTADYGNGHKSGAHPPFERSINNISPERFPHFPLESLDTRCQGKVGESASGTWSLGETVLLTNIQKKI